MISAAIAVLNLVVVIMLAIYTKNATASARAQAEVAVRTLGELDLEKKLQNSRELMRAEGCLKDLGDNLLVLEKAIQSIHFRPEEWKAKPSDWHEIADAVICMFPLGSHKVADLQEKMRTIDIRLQFLASAPLDNERYHEGKDDLKGLVHETHSLIREVWEGMMKAVV